MNYIAPKIVRTASISKEVQELGSNKANPRVIDNPITQGLGSSSAYEADE